MKLRQLVVLEFSMLGCRGEKAEVRSEHSFCYGGSGDGERVPGGADLELELELLDWVDLPPVPDIPRYISDQFSSVQLYTCRPERMGIGVTKRERGNWWFSRGEYSLAVQVL